jgi:hypothetical protein
VKYVKIQWVHSHPDEPVWVYCELDNEHLEVRKVELFPNGAKGYADALEEVGGTRMAWEPHPTLEEIASDPQFVPSEITMEEFERVWKSRRQS